MPGLSVVILAAGQGKRMYSDLPKVLHPLGGRPLLSHVVATALTLKPQRTLVIYGHGGGLVPERLAHLPVEWVCQDRQLGTGHAVAQAMPGVPDEDTVLVLYGDVPLTRPETLQRLIDLAGSERLGLITVEMDNPAGYGRIVRDPSGKVASIVEHKDADSDQLAIREVNTGILAVPARLLKAWLALLDNDNNQGEYYLTDIVAMAVGRGMTIHTVHPDGIEEVTGINNRSQLAQLERAYQREQAERLMAVGVTLADPMRLDVRGEVSAGRDVFIDVNVILEGRVVLQDGVHVGPNNYIRDSEVGSGCEILANCVIEDAVIGDVSRVGPFARIRPESRLGEGVHVGNFVEIKKSTVDQGSKINHLSYVGDARVGREVNIGAGTITCNYDGANKHQTVIGDRAFIGSDTQLVAPVSVGEGATIGAGSTIVRNAPPGELTLSRAPQATRKGWRRPSKKQPP